MSTKKASLTKTNKKSNKSVSRIKTSNVRRKATKRQKSAAPNRFLCLITIVILGAAGLITVILITVLSYFSINKTIDSADAIRFASEYSTVSEDNVFVYASGEEVVNIIERGTGVVFLGFPSCVWCQAYAGYLNDAAKEAGLTTIYYHNTYDDWQNNTEVYQRLTQLLSSYLQLDDEGNPHLYVPDAVFVVDGLIVANDYETSKDTAGETDPSTYWTESRVANLKNRLSEDIQLVLNTDCTESCDRD